MKKKPRDKFHDDFHGFYEDENEMLNDEFNLTEYVYQNKLQEDEFIRRNGMEEENMNLDSAYPMQVQGWKFQKEGGGSESIPFSQF